MHKNINIQLHKFFSLPEGFLDASPENLYQTLPGPSLFYIEGEVKQPIFVSTLLHGNETTGLFALQNLLRPYTFNHDPLPRSLLIFVGNVFAARHHVRHLPNQLDYNRIWNGGAAPENILAKEVLGEVHDRKPMLCIDIHNTSGKNPHYACVASLDEETLGLGRLFSEKLVHFFGPPSAQTAMLAKTYPSITIECGRSEDTTSIPLVVSLLEKCLRLESVPQLQIGDAHTSVYETIGRILAPHHADVRFMPDPAGDIRFVENFEDFNFSKVSQNTLLGWTTDSDLKLMIENEKGQDVSDQFLTYKNGEIRAKQDIYPSMLTNDPLIVHQDCVGYIMSMARKHRREEQ